MHVRRQLIPLVAAGALLSSPVAAQSVAGDFDFYVLSLSWSPTFCAATPDKQDSRQCRGDHGFIVHGLWPQYESGYPEYCDAPYPARVPYELGEGYFDIMPDMGLIGHQWRKHGTCTGLSPASYFEQTRAAFGAVTLPDSLDEGGQDLRASPDEFEAAIIAANPALSAEGIAVTCENGQLEEIRICLTRDLDFRDCAEVNADSCRAGSIELPAR